jgi:hypothetical protein
MENTEYKYEVNADNEIIEVVNGIRLGQFLQEGNVYSFRSNGLSLNNSDLEFIAATSKDLNDAANGKLLYLKDVISEFYNTHLSVIIAIANDINKDIFNNLEIKKEYTLDKIISEIFYSIRNEITIDKLEELIRKHKPELRYLK